MLDVLGWQGREKEFTDKWQLVTDDGISATREVIQQYKIFHGINCLIGVFETDSFMIAAWQENKEITKELFAFAASTANAFFAACWHKSLPLRGCLSVGEFTATSDLKVSGDALNEVRSEFSIMNWAGCHATASANKLLDIFVPKYKVLTDNFVSIEDPPYKDKSLTGMRWVLNWPYAFYHQPEESQLREIMKNELANAKSDKDRSKHERAIRFFEKVYAALEDRERRRAADTQNKDDGQGLQSDLC